LHNIGKQALRVIDLVGRTNFETLQDKTHRCTSFAIVRPVVLRGSSESSLIETQRALGRTRPATYAAE
jgi:hypothetical protein